MPNIAGELWQVFNVDPQQFPDLIIPFGNRLAEPYLYAPGIIDPGEWVLFTGFTQYEALVYTNLNPPPPYIVYDSVPIEVWMAYGDDAIRHQPSYVTEPNLIPPGAGYAVYEVGPYLF